MLNWFNSYATISFQTRTVVPRCWLMKIYWKLVDCLYLLLCHVSWAVDLDFGARIVNALGAEMGSEVRWIAVKWSDVRWREGKRCQVKCSKLQRSEVMWREGKQCRVKCSKLQWSEVKGSEVYWSVVNCSEVKWRDANWSVVNCSEEKWREAMWSEM